MHTLLAASARDPVLLSASQNGSVFNMHTEDELEFNCQRQFDEFNELIDR